MSKRQFYLRWLKEAFFGPLPKVRLTAFLLAVGGGGIAYFVPDVETFVRTVVWAASVAVLVGAIMVGFITAPFRICTEEEQAREQLAAQLHAIESSSPNLVFSRGRVVPMFGPAIRWTDDRPEKGDPDYYMVQAWFLNTPKVASEATVAKRVTAVIEHGARRWHGEWAISEDAAKAGFSEITQVIDVEPNHIPAKLIIAVKYPGEQDAYIYSTGTPTFKDERNELPIGEHKLKVKLSGVNVGPDQQFDFTLTNKGVGGTESLELRKDDYS